MANRFRAMLYVGVTTHLAARIHQHRTGSGLDFFRRYGLNSWYGTSMASKSTRVFEFTLIEYANPDWREPAELWI